MNKLYLISIGLCLLCAGCLDNKDGENKISVEPPKKPLSVAITSPAYGTIFSGDQEIKFDSSVKGGSKPYTYRWTSNLNGVLSKDTAFTRKSSTLQKGEHYFILKVTDARNNSSEATAIVRVF